MGLGTILGSFFGGASTEVVKGAADAVMDSAERIKTLITGSLPPDKVAEFEMEWAKLHQSVNLAQTEINKIDAASGNMFQAGWRPAVGWSCAITIFVYYVPRALLSSGVWMYMSITGGTILAMPEMGISDIIGLLGALLGFGWLRSTDIRSGARK